MGVYKSKFTGEEIDSAVEKISTALTEPLYQNIVYEYETSNPSSKRYVGFIYYSKTPLTTQYTWGWGNDPPTKISNTTLADHLKTTFEIGTISKGVPVQVFGIVYDDDDDGYYTTTPAYGRIVFSYATTFQYVCRMPAYTNNLENQFISFSDNILDGNPLGSFYATTQQIY